jgi:hypothetical protein
MIEKLLRRVGRNNKKPEVTHPPNKITQKLYRPEPRSNVYALIVKDSDTFRKFSDIEIKNVETDTEHLFSQLSLTMQGHFIQFMYSGTDYDKSGIVYWLGTDKSGSEYRNPHESGLISLEAYPSLYEGELAWLVGDDLSRRIYTQHSPEAYFMFDFRPANISIKPTEYTIGYGCCSTHPRNWVLQGSNDVEHWTTLMEHVNDTNINSNEGKSHTWKLDPIFGDFSVLKIKITGMSAHNNYFLVLNCFEVYGHVYNHTKKL